jgi:sugar lactone lactonase YvrE
MVSTLAGKAGDASYFDGPGQTARFYFPFGVAVGATGTVYVSDSQNQAIRKITPAGVVSSLAGVSDNRMGAPGRFGPADGVGAAASFHNPEGLAVDAAGTVYVADTNNNTIRKITAAGVVTTLAGTARSTGSADGTGAAARFYHPTGVAVDAAGTVYVADNLNHTIRKITPAGMVSTLAGAAGEKGSADGVGAAARFYRPASVAVDEVGTLYVSDSNNHTIRKITPAGVVSTLAGTAGSPGSADGTGAAARFNIPLGVAVDRAGTVYVAEPNNHTIRKITAGVVTTLAGAAGDLGWDDGLGNKARFFRPCGVAVAAAGTVYVADEGNNTIRVIR